MAELPSALQCSVEAALGTRLQSATPLEGGMICRAVRLRTSDGDLFLKWHPAAPRGFFEAEARGLELQRSANALQVPHVLAWREAESGAPAWLSLEWVDTVAIRDEAEFARGFAEGLAAQHRVTAPCYGDPEGRANFLGECPQINPPHAAWASFFGECRLEPLIKRCRERGSLNDDQLRLLDGITERLDDLLAGGDTYPALLHGDLWSGNYLPARYQKLTQPCPVVIDPAPYFGSREVELAYVELFGGFPRGFVEIYRQTWPLPGGYERRRPVLQAYPLLIHVLHFGASYGPKLEEVCRQTLST